MFIRGCLERHVRRRSRGSLHHHTDITARKLWNTLFTVMGRDRGRSPAPSGLLADSFLKFFNDKVGDVRSSTAGAAGPDYSIFHGQGLDEFQQLSASKLSC